MRIFSDSDPIYKEEWTMKNRKRLAAVAFASVLGAAVLGSGMTTFAASGWVQNGNNYVYYDADGSLHKGWINTSDGYYYAIEVSDNPEI